MIVQQPSPAAQSSSGPARGVSLRHYQTGSLTGIRAAFDRGERSTLVVAATGCHRAGQLILMHDGSAQRVEDIVAGDQLMGPDGTPRTVLQLARGQQEMVEIRPTKGEPWVVNLDHVLTLVETNTGKPGRGGRIVDVTVRNWLSWNRHAKHTHKLFRVGVEFPYRGPPRIEPYVLGVLLGDGSLKRGVTVTAADREIWVACEPEAQRWGLKFIPLTPADRCHGFRFASDSVGPNANPMLAYLDRLGLKVSAAAKFIPEVYKLGLPAARAELLAGLIDTDGHMLDGGFEYTSKSRQLADDVAFVARSLGLAAYVKAKQVRYRYKATDEDRTFYRVHISGDCSAIPCRVFRKRAPARTQKKDVLRSGFTVVPTNTVENYYGFSLDGDQRYLLGDFTVTHNTGKTVTFAELARIEVSHGGRVLVIVNRDELLKQARRKCEAVGLWPDVEKAERRASTTARVVLASVQSLRGKRLLRWARDHFDLIIVDEAHHAAAKGYQAILAHFEEARVVGFTATPIRADGIALGDTFQSVAFRYDIRDAIRDGFLVPVIARRVVVDSVDLSEITTRAGDFAQNELAAVMTEARALHGQAIASLEQAEHRLAIAFCVDVAHATKFAETLNTYRPGCARAVSGETDDDEREELLAAHAAGEFQFLTNCDLLVEGYDCPPASCVIMNRPTKSWGRYVQCAGRGLRLLGDTLAESIANGKVNCKLVDLSGTAGRHKLVGPIDCLRGSDEPEIADDVREEIDRLLGSAQMPLGNVLELAEQEAARRRATMAITAVVKYRAENIDPFIGAEDEPEEREITLLPGDWSKGRPSEKQLAALEKAGVTLKKLPLSLTAGDASKLLARFGRRINSGLCSYKAARMLTQSGVRDTRRLTHKRAKELVEKLRKAGWSASAIKYEPEVCGVAEGAAF